jgi:CzcA family heavy metal efflux pump
VLRWIIGTSLRFRLLVVGLAAGVLAVGIVQLRDAPTDVLPEFAPPYAEVQTEAPGLSAQEVEQFITVPLEADLLNGVQGVDVIRSESVPGVSSITMVFEPGTDVYRARQLVQERLTQAHALPNVSDPPTLLAPVSASSRLMMIALSSKELSPIEKSVIARWTVQPRLMGVAGVANVAMWGWRDQQLQVQVDPERLRDRDVTLSQVVSTTGNSQVVSPLSFLEASTPGSGGFIETPQQRLQVRNVLERIAEPKQLGKVPVEGTGGRLQLGEVADIKVDHQPLIGDAVVNEGEGLLLVVEKFPDANTLDVTEGVEDALEDLRPGLSGLQTDTSVFRPASYIEDAVDNIGLAVTIAAILSLVALAALMLRWRTVVVAAVAVPVSMVAAALVLDAMGESFNAISFAGLAVALAIVVDDAVVGAESVGRRLREHRAEGGVASTSALVTEASHEVRSPLAYGTLIALLAIVPVAIMDGRPGAFFEPLVLAYALAVVAAMVVALTVTPALSLLLFSRGKPNGGEPALLARAGARYAGALGGLLRRPRAALIAAAVCVAVGLVVLPLLSSSLVPSFKDRDVLISLASEPGTSNAKMTAVAGGLSRELRSIPGVEEVGAHVGRAVSGDQIVDVNSSEVWVGLRPGADFDDTLGDVKEVVARTRGIDHDVTTYTAQRIRDVGGLEEGVNPVQGSGLDVLSGSDQPLVVRVYGQDLDVLRREAARVRGIVAEVDGVVDPRIELPDTQPTLQIEVDLDKAREAGVKPGDVRRAEATYLHGLQVGSIFQQQKVFQVVVQGTPEVRASVDSVRNLLIDKPGGGQVRLGDVADVRTVPTPAVIERDAVSRRVDIEATVSGRGLDAVAGDIERRLQDTRFPLEYHAEVLTPTTAEEIGTTRMAAFAIACALATLLLLQAAFRSWRLAALVFLTLPVALVGGVLVMLVDGAEITLGGAAALLALYALAARNGVVLVRRLQELEHEGAAGASAELVQHGARERLGAMLTSAVAVAVAVLPFAILSGPGLEVLDPMAVVLLGGLVTTTLLGLFLLPALYLRFGTGHEPEAAPDEDLLYRWAGVSREPHAEAGAAGATSRTERWRPVEEAPAGEPAEAAGTGEREQ